MPQARNKALEVAQRRARVAEMYLRGKYQWEIGEVVGVTQKTISLDLAAIRAMWKAAAIRDFDEAKEKELARIDALEREYWSAWEKSKEEKESTHTEKSEQPGGASRLKAAVKKEERDGNPAFLAGVQWCINKRCEILGFDAPRKLKHEHLSKDGRSFVEEYEQLKRLPADELAKLYGQALESPEPGEEQPEVPGA